jgi:hypothetical protein
MQALSEDQDNPSRVFVMCLKEASYAFASLLYHVDQQSSAFQEKYFQDVEAEFATVAKKNVYPNTKKDCLGCFDMIEVVPVDIVKAHYEQQSPDVRLSYALTAMKNAACRPENRKIFLAAQESFFLDDKTAHAFSAVRRDVIGRVDVTANSVKSRLIDLVKKDPDIAIIQSTTHSLFQENDPFLSVVQEGKIIHSDLRAYISLTHPSVAHIQKAHKLQAA